MALFVFSDLHISDEEDPLYQAFLSVLSHGFERPQSGDTLVIAGDLFDLFVGNKKVFLNRYSAFFDSMRSLANRGVSLHYIEGNHDFFLKTALSSIPSLQVHSADFDLELGGKRFFFAHGDQVDCTEYGYRLLRGFFRSPVMKTLVSVVPGEWLDLIGKKSSQYSRSKKPLLIQDLETEKAERLRRVYRSFAAERLCEGYDFVVLGHCHDLDEMWFNVGDRRGQYINVGYPRLHGAYLLWTPHAAEEKTGFVRKSFFDSNALRREVSPGEVRNSPGLEKQSV